MDNKRSDSDSSLPKSHSEGAAPGEPWVEISLLRMINLILRNWRVLLASVGLASVLAIILFSRQEDEYMAQSVFQPQTSQGAMSQYAGMAAQLGLNLGARAEAGGESLQFYAALLTSRELLSDLVLSEYGTLHPGLESGLQHSTTLIDLYGVEGETAGQRINAAVAVARRNVLVEVDPATGLVELNTIASTPELAVELNERLLKLVNAFNSDRRQSQAVAERAFVESRLKEAEIALEEAEAALERFFEQNRSYQASPQLNFEANRLQRRVQLRQGIYTSLAQSYEQARIEEVRDTPILTMVDTPQGSALPRPKRGLATLLVLAVLAGGFVGVGVVFTMEYFSRERENYPDAYAEFKGLGRSLAPLRKVRRHRRSGSGED